MAMNLLQLVQEFCGGRGLPVPSYVVGNPDPGVLQIKAILNEFLLDLQTRKAWQRNTFETVFTSVAGEDQGDILTLCPFGFEQILWETIFDRTERLPLRGGVSPAEWQARKAFQITGPWYQFRLRQNRLLFSPDLPVDHEIAFEYYGSNFVWTAGDVAITTWTTDTDTCTLGDGLPRLYLGWKWPMKKGFDYAEDFAAYERLLAVKAARDNRPPAVDLAGNTCDFRPGIFVPEGNWNLP